MDRKELTELLDSELPVTREMLAEAVAGQQQYIWLTIDKGVRNYACTACGETYTIPELRRTYLPEETELSRARHGDRVKCPHCGAAADVENSKIRINKFVLNQNVCVLYIRKINENRIVCRAVNYYRIFQAVPYYHTYLRPAGEGLDYMPTPQWQREDLSAYIITPGNADAYEFTYGGIIKMRTVLEPFSYHSSAQTVYADYTVCPIDGGIEASWLRYAWDAASGLECTRGERRLRYLCFAARYPCVEMLLKRGFHSIVKALLYGQQNCGIINWQAQNRSEVFKGLSASELRALDDFPQGKNADAIRAYKRIRAECGRASWAQAESASLFFGTKIAQTRRCKACKIKLTDAFHYCEKQFNNYAPDCHCGNVSRGHITQLYLDYLDLAVKLNYDLTQQEVLFPRDISAAHDRAAEAHTAMLKERERLETKKLLAEYKRRKKQLELQYVYAAGGLQIVLPKSVAEIISEGQKMHNCIAGYARRHFEGNATVFFLRTSDAPKQPYIDIEANGMQIKQAYAGYNHAPDEYAQAWLNHYKKWLAAGSPRNKAGAPSGKYKPENFRFVPSAAAV